MKMYLCLFLVLASGCTTNFYVPKTDNTPHGYSDRQIDDTRHEVNFETYRDLDIEKAKDYVHYRSAELASENGYEFYKIENIAQEIVQETVTVPAMYRSFTAGMGSSAGSVIGPVVVQEVSPSYLLEYEIKRCTAEVSFTNDGSVPGTLNAHQIIERGFP